MTHSLALQIQQLGGFNEQVLLLLHVAQLQNSGSPVPPSAIAGLFRSFYLPPPTNERQHLNELRKKAYAMQPAPGVWAATPLGVGRIRELIGGVSDAQLSAMVARSEEPMFGGAPHHLIPAALAPAKFEPGVSLFLERHPFERNVFCMTRYADSPKDPVRVAVEACRVSCLEFGLELHLANDRAVDEALFENVAAYMWSCQYGIAILEAREGELNYNVIFETGAMLATGRRCLLLKDGTAPDYLPSDLIGRIYKPVDLDDPATVRVAVREWAETDLAIPPYPRIASGSRAWEAHQAR